MHSLISNVFSAYGRLYSYLKGFQNIESSTLGKIGLRSGKILCENSNILFTITICPKVTSDISVIILRDLTINKLLKSIFNR